MYLFYTTNHLPPPPINQFRSGLTECLGRPMMEGNTALGASSPPNPALHIPDPLSMTTAAISSSAIVLR